MTVTRPVRSKQASKQGSVAPSQVSEEKKSEASELDEQSQPETPKSGASAQKQPPVIASSQAVSQKPSTVSAPQPPYTPPLVSQRSQSPPVSTPLRPPTAASPSRTIGSHSAPQFSSTEYFPGTARGMASLRGSPPLTFPGQGGPGSAIGGGVGSPPGGFGGSPGGFGGSPGGFGGSPGGFGGSPGGFGGSAGVLSAPHGGFAAASGGMPQINYYSDIKHLPPMSPESLEAVLRSQNLALKPDGTLVKKHVYRVTRVRGGRCGACNRCCGKCCDKDRLCGCCNGKDACCERRRFIFRRESGDSNASVWSAATILEPPKKSKNGCC